MFKRLLIVFMLLNSTAFTQEDFIISSTNKKAIAHEIELVTENWYSEDENIGSIWVNPFEEESSYFPYEFEIIDWISATHFVIDVTFGCGSEFDSSEYQCKCQIDNLKDETSNEWVPVLESTDKCSMDFYN